MREGLHAVGLEQKVVHRRDASIARHFDRHFHGFLAFDFQFAFVHVAEASLTDLFRQREIFAIDLPFLAELTPDVAVVRGRMTFLSKLLRGLREAATSKHD